jgi:hypothetical protein
MKDNRKCFFSSYDFETTQDLHIEDGRTKHIVNFVACDILCTRCINDGSWKENNNNIDENKKNQQCEICGASRMHTFAPFELPSRNISDHHVVTENPVGDFIEFLLKQTNTKFPTYAFAHNAGRFGIICKK